MIDIRWTRRRAAAISFLGLAACVAPSPLEDDGPTGTSAEAWVASDLVELRSYWNASFGDNALSSDPAFAPIGYRFFRIEGKVFRPDRPAPPGTHPLYTWYSATRGDHFTTGNPYWAATAPGTLRDGYRFVRNEGFAFDLPFAGTQELHLWWSAGRADNFTTSDPVWVAARGRTQSPDYGFARSEGWVLPPPPNAGPEALANFHHGTMGGGPRGERPLLALMLNYRDEPFRHTRTQTDALLFGPSAPNVRDYTREISHGRFAWSRGSVELVDVLDDPETSGDEGSWALSWDSADRRVLYPYLEWIDPSDDKPRYVGAENGGGAGTFVAPHARDWETFVLHDLDGGDLENGDVVSFKTWGETWLREASSRLKGDAAASSFTSARFQIQKVSGDGVIRAGDAVAIRSRSNGKFLGRDLQITSPRIDASTTFTFGKGAPDMTRQTRQAVRAAAAAGFDFARYDRNGDGTLQPEELQILLIGSGRAVVNGGATRGIGAIPIPGRALTIAGRQVCGMGEDVSISTITHELAHTLGTVDLYGASGLNQNLTLMGATIFGGIDDRQTFHLDPWHRLRLGWTEPRVRMIGGAGGSAELVAPQAGGITLTEAKRPLLLVDPERYDVRTRRGEYFLVEFRASSAGGYDANSGVRGVVVWQVSTTSDGGVEIIPSLTVPRGIDASVNTFGAPSGTRGGRGTWSQSDGRISLRYRDGTDARIVLRVSALQSTGNGAYVEWSRIGDFRPRVDGGSASGFAGETIALDGVFSVDPANSVVRLISRATGAPYDLPIASSTHARIFAGLPASIPAGLYDLRVWQGPRASNAQAFQMR
jgi:M6 family metalloprotease-like protein